ncbi:MAG: type II toxin-antitoxin system Phd/YefM family antitoxin [Hyphomicrobiales bacterium]
MRQFSAFDAKNKFGTLLDLVEQGEEVVVTRHGKPVARLVAESSVSKKRTPEEAKKLVEEFRQMAKGVTLNGISIKELIEEGRK